MSQCVTVAAAMAIAEHRLQAYLDAPVVPASAWTEQEWSGVCEPWSDRAERHQYYRELGDAIAECDSWVDGHYAGQLCDLDDGDGSLTLGFDAVTGSLSVDFDVRVDFRLPSLVWAFTVFRGMAGSMADDDTGLVTVTGDWNGDTALMHLSPNRSSFLDRRRDAAAWAKARDMEFDIRCAIPDAEESAADVIASLLQR